MTTSPFVDTKPWQDTIFDLSHRWFTTGLPTHADFDRFFQAVYLAYQHADKVGWSGDNPLYDEAFSDGAVSRDDEISDLQSAIEDGP